MIILEQIDKNHVRRYSDKGVKIHNNKDGHDYDVAEDWSDEWFQEHNVIAPTYNETEIPVEKEENEDESKQTEINPEQQ